MVIATQRPSVDVVTGLIKANFLARIAFAVTAAPTAASSWTSTGAERLLGQGRHAIPKSDAAAPVRLQRLLRQRRRIGPSHQLLADGAPGAGDRRADQHGRDRQQPDPRRERPGGAGGPRPGDDRAADGRRASPSAPERAGADADAPAPQQRAPRIPTKPPDTPAQQPAFIAPAPAPQPATEQPATDDEQPSAISGLRSDDMLQQPLWEALQEMENGHDDTVENDVSCCWRNVALVRSINKASTSLLQRRFALATRAPRGWWMRWKIRASSARRRGRARRGRFYRR